MYPKDELVLVGKLSKTFGHQGQLRFEWNDEAWSTFIDSYHFVFVENKGDFIPLRVVEEDGAIVRFKDIDSPEAASQISGENLYLPLADVPEEQWAQLSEKTLLFQKDFWTLHDENTGRTIENVTVEEFPQQIMASFLLHEQPVHIPLNDQTIVSIDPGRSLLTVHVDQEIWHLFE